MTFRSHTKQTKEPLAEVVISADIGPATIKSLARSLAEDAETYERHLTIKADARYSRPVFPNEPYPMLKYSNWR